MREAFAQTLIQCAREDPRVAFITGDLGFQVFDKFAEQFGSRYINAGVAEAQMIYTAAGLALEGWRPIAYSIASFATARPYEQLRYCIAYHHLPVMLVGAGRGYLYSTSGVSHHAPDDLGLLSLLPGMTVTAPGDPTEVEQLMPQLMRLEGPSYMTVGRYGEPRYEAEEAAIVGKARRLRSGERVAILSTGEIANEVLKARQILEAQDIYPVCCQFHTIKPLDTGTLDYLAERVDAFFIVEEHLPQGGLWSAVCEWRAGSVSPVQLNRAGSPDQFALGNLKQADLRRKFGLDAESLADRCQELWCTRYRVQIKAA